jgi:hypothetical protein
MAKDKKKDHARAKAKKEPGKRKAIAAAAAGDPVDAPDPGGSEPRAAKTDVRPAEVAAPNAARGGHPATTARRRPTRAAAPDRTSGGHPATTARRRPTKVAAPDPAGGVHHAAKAHGRPTQVDTSLPGTRPELMALHAAARARRNAAALDSPAFRAAIMDLERIEIRIAAVDRAVDPPLG